MFIFLTLSVLTLSTCILLTPLARALAIRKDWYDTPGPLKIHQIPTPRLGGATMMAALLLGTVTAPAVLRPSLVVILALLGVWTAGLVDDLRGVPALMRLGVQMVAAGALYVAGWSLHWSSIPLLDCATSVLFFALMVNAMNFLDGMDGLALMVSSVVATGFILLFAVSANGPSLWLSCGILAACVGTLFYNYPPARIFIGDSGSNLLGAVFAFLYFDWIRTTPGNPSRPAVLLFLALPLIDSLAAIVRRVRAGFSPLSGDRRHFYDLLRGNGWPIKRILLFSSLATGGFVVVGLVCARGSINSAMGVVATVGAALPTAYFLGSFSPAQKECSQVPISAVGDSCD